jgi:hypothetical protein
MFEITETIAVVAIICTATTVQTMFEAGNTEYHDCVFGEPELLSRRGADTSSAWRRGRHEELTWKTRKTPNKGSPATHCSLSADHRRFT